MQHRKYLVCCGALWIAVCLIQVVAMSNDFSVSVAPKSVEKPLSDYACSFASTGFVSHACSRYAENPNSADGASWAKLMIDQGAKYSQIASDLRTFSSIMAAYTPVLLVGTAFFVCAAFRTRPRECYSRKMLCFFVLNFFLYISVIRIHPSYGIDHDTWPYRIVYYLWDQTVAFFLIAGAGMIGSAALCFICRSACHIKCKEN